MEINTNFYGNPKISSQVSGYVNYNIGMEPDVSFTFMNKGGMSKQWQVIWRVILPPGEDFWRVGMETGVRLQHVSTGKYLTVTR